MIILQGSVWNIHSFWEMEVALYLSSQNIQTEKIFYPVINLCSASLDQNDHMCGGF